MVEVSALINLAKRVAELRDNIQTGIGERNVAEQKVEETPEGKEYNKICYKIATLSEELMMAESALKSATVSVFKETGERKPIDRVEVKIFKSLEYEPAEVLAWCRTNAPSLLVVNKKPFEKTAVEIGAPVEVKEEAKCMLAQDMSIYLKIEAEKGDEENGK